MKKLILGLLIMCIAPFIIIFGAMILNALKVQDGAFLFASILGGITVVTNYIIGIMLVIQWHAENKTFADKSV